jgi:hypothetical protein
MPGRSWPTAPPASCRSRPRTRRQRQRRGHLHRAALARRVDRARRPALGARAGAANSARSTSTPRSRRPAGAAAACWWCRRCCANWCRPWTRRTWRARASLLLAAWCWTNSRMPTAGAGRAAAAGANRRQAPARAVRSGAARAGGAATWRVGGGHRASERTMARLFATSWDQLPAVAPAGGARPRPAPARARACPSCQCRRPPAMPATAPSRDVQGRDGPAAQPASSARINSRRVLTEGRLRRMRWRSATAPGHAAVSGLRTRRSIGAAKAC